MVAKIAQDYLQQSNKRKCCYHHILTKDLKNYHLNLIWLMKKEGTCPLIILKYKNLRVAVDSEIFIV